MDKPTMMNFEGIYPLTLSNYKRYIPTAFDNSLDILEKIHLLLKRLNEIGEVSNEVIEKWNEIMKWVMSDGLNQSVIDKINQLITDGVFDNIINHQLFGELMDEIAVLIKKTPYVTYSMFDVDSRNKYFNPNDRKYYLDENFNEEYTIDDGVLIKKAHEFANENNLPIKLSGGHYVIKDTRNIEVFTSFDRSNSTFHIDESSSNQPVFNIKSKKVTKTLEPIYNTTVLPYMKKGVKKIPPLALYENHYVVIYDELKRIGIRQGENQDSGSIMQTALYIGKGGKVIGDIDFDFDNVTKITVVECDKTTLFDEGGTFLLSGNLGGSSSYSANGITVNRSNVITRNVTISLEDGVNDISTVASDGFYRYFDCFNIEYVNINNTPRKYPTLNNVPVGSYSLNLSRVVNFNIIRAISESELSSDWGSVYTSFCKNLFVENSKLNRVDAHIRIWNVTLINSQLGKEGLRIVGGGKLYINNTTIENYLFLNLRGDYGATWDGDITINDSTSIITGNGEAKITAFSSPDHDFGYNIVFGENIKIFNHTLDYRNAESEYIDRNAFIWFFSSHSGTSGRKLRYPKSIIVDKINVIGREKGIRIGLIENPDKVQIVDGENFTKTNDDIKTNALMYYKNIPLEKIFFKDNDSSETHLKMNVRATDSYLPNGYVPKIIIENCDNITFKLYESIFKLFVKDSVVNGILAKYGNYTQGKVVFQNVEFKPNLLDGGIPITIDSNCVDYINTTFFPIKVNDVINNALTAGYYGAFDLRGVSRSVFGTHIGSTLSDYIINNNEVPREMIVALNSHNKRMNERILLESSSSNYRPAQGSYDGYEFKDATLKKTLTWYVDNWYDEQGNIVS